ncbi:protein flp-like [Physella acuta]|uniref:protein flp-like n=1 Tax=Physella acuta TaxID=109671 RepID=UPI0027DE4194|nr:protein flp-like [Physella acuta]
MVGVRRLRSAWLSLCLLLCLLLCLPVFSQDVGDMSVEFDANEISDVINTSYSCHSNPAMAVAVVKDGKVLLSRGYGTFGLSSEKPVTGKSVFGIASLSKAFTAALFYKLLREKTNITLASPVRLLLGKKFMMPDEFRTKETTFEDLLSHKTAVPDYNRLRFNDNFTRQNLLEKLHLLQTRYQFRVKYIYSNLMYGLVTRISEILGGKKWEELMKENLFQPLGMTSTTFSTEADFNRGDIVVPYAEIHSKLVQVNPEFSRRWADMAGSGSIMSSADDMAKWMNFHLNASQNGTGDQVLKPELLDELHEGKFYVGDETSSDLKYPQFPVATSDSVYGLGWRIGFFRGFERISHTGSTLGYRAIISIIPRQKIGIFIAMSGSDDSFRHRIPLLMYLTDRALGLKPFLNASTICSYPEPWKPKPKPKPPVVFNANVTLLHDIQQYEGLYYNKLFGYLSIHYNKTLGLLVMSYGWGQWHLYLQSVEQREKFYGRGIGINEAYDISPVYFNTKTKDGNVSIIGMDATALEFSMPPKFTKVTNDKVKVKESNAHQMTKVNLYVLACLLILLVIL